MATNDLTHLLSALTAMYYYAADQKENDKFVWAETMFWNISEQLGDIAESHIPMDTNGLDMMHKRIMEVTQFIDHERDLNNLMKGE